MSTRTMTTTSLNNDKKTNINYTAARRRRRILLPKGARVVDDGITKFITIISLSILLATYNIFTGCWILLYLIGYSVVATCVYNVVDDVVSSSLFLLRRLVQLLLVVVVVVVVVMVMVMVMVIVVTHSSYCKMGDPHAGFNGDHFVYTPIGFKLI